MYFIAVHFQGNGDESGENRMLECQITKPLNRQESSTVIIEYDVRKLLAGTPHIAWKNIYVQSNSQSAIDEDRTNDNGINSIYL